MPEEETVEQTETVATPEAIEQKVDAAIDAWLVSVANTGEPWAMRRADRHADALKATIHTILKEN